MKPALFSLLLSEYRLSSRHKRRSERMPPLHIIMCISENKIGGAQKCAPPFLLLPMADIFTQ